MRNKITVPLAFLLVILFSCIPAILAGEELPAPPDQAKETTENSDALKADVEKLKKLKISGFIQAQYENHQDSEEGIDASGKPQNYDNFLIRRGRLKAEYAATKKSKYLVYIDASKDKVKLLDAYAEFKLPYDVKITFGQYKWPFGYEIPQSSSDREMPERANVINQLFPGVRDRGIKASGEMKIGEKNRFDYTAGIFNGTGIEDKTFTWQDADKHKDIVGRMGLDLGKIRFGLSAYSGKELVPGKPAVPGSTTWYDADGDGVIDEGEYVTKEPVAATPDVDYTKDRYGLDFQWYFKMLDLGESAFKAEYIQGKQRGNDVDGWYGLFVQHFGKRNTFALRVDSYDPDKDADDDEITSYIPAWLFDWDANLRFTLAYEMPKEKGERKADNNVITFRVQYKF